jgi:hypothetical protein
MSRKSYGDSENTASMLVHPNVNGTRQKSNTSAISLLLMASAWTKAKSRQSLIGQNPVKSKTFSHSQAFAQYCHSADPAYLEKHFLELWLEMSHSLWEAQGRIHPCPGINPLGPWCADHSWNSCFRLCAHSHIVHPHYWQWYSPSRFPFTLLQLHGT